MKDLLKMHRIQEYYFTVESENIPERYNQSFSLFTSCLIDLVYIIARKRMQIFRNIGGCRRRGDQICKKTIYSV